MKAIKYKVKITTDIAHGFGEVIKEIFIPESKVVINERGFAFRSEEARDNIEVEEIEIDDEDAYILGDYVDSLNKLKSITEKLF